MLILPTLTTPRLLLRPFAADDAAAVHAHVGDAEVASTTAAIPHPYPDGAADAWIALHGEWLAAGTAAVLAITRREDGVLAGSMTLRMEMKHRRGELAYWVGRAFWGRGYATEAADAMLRWGFGALGLHRIHATHMARNPASGAVLRKIGMRHEGTLRGHLHKGGVAEDLEVWGMLRDELPPHGPALAVPGGSRPSALHDDGAGGGLHGV